MTWFDDASADGERAADAPLPERRRSRGVLVAWLLGGGLAVGLLVAGAVSAVAHFVDNQNAAGPDAPGTPRPEAALTALTCGDPAPPADTDPERTLTAQVDVNDPDVAGVYAAGEELPVIAGLVNVGDETLVRIESDLAVVVARDGVVAGEPVTVDLRDPDERRADPYRMRVPMGIGVTAETTAPLVGCDGEPLAPGEYTLVVGVRVAVLGAGGEADAAGGEVVGEATELVGESVPFRVD